MATLPPSPFVDPETIGPDPVPFHLDEPRFWRDIMIFLPPNDPTRMLLSKEFAPIVAAIARR